MKKKEFKEMLKSIDQARAIHEGRLKPNRVYRFEPVKVTRIREKLGLTQGQFADMLCISLATLRNWEQGRTFPEGAAIALLRVADSKPEAVLQALHAA